MERMQWLTLVELHVSEVFSLILVGKRQRNSSQKADRQFQGFELHQIISRF
jgi:hypothetical protein